MFMLGRYYSPTQHPPSISISPSLAPAQVQHGHSDLGVDIIATYRGPDAPAADGNQSTTDAAFERDGCFATLRPRKLPDREETKFLGRQRRSDQKSSSSSTRRDSSTYESNTFTCEPNKFDFKHAMEHAVRVPHKCHNFFRKCVTLVS